jgi:hypothetical protein
MISSHDVGQNHDKLLVFNLDVRTRNCSNFRESWFQSVIKSLTDRQLSWSKSRFRATT